MKSAPWKSSIPQIAGHRNNSCSTYLRRMKAANSGWKVLDIGGAYCPWTAEVADAFVDLFPIDGHDVLIGDINEEPIWEEISQRHFDFCICSHTLEDAKIEMPLADFFPD